MTAFDYPVDGNEAPEIAKALYANPGKDKVVVFDTPFAPVPAGGFKPRVFADGLAIPLGILPYKDGCYVQHGPNIELLHDTDGDGRADKTEVILSGFGVQDSHLFPHQFTRAPGGWIWMAQGAFNSGKVRDKGGREQQFDATRMAKFRPDGSGFEITSQGPCNIWGLVIDDVGQAWIQEANDYGFPVMPFHEYANYPGCSDRLFKSYAPEFPGTAPHFKMGGTGLSGLALSDKAESFSKITATSTNAFGENRVSEHLLMNTFPAAYCDVMFVANPITRQIQAIKITPEGTGFRYDKLPDFINSSDEMFRPIAIHFGPDGCLYIVDWYNKIISHNEVPRNHPDRDKTRGRIWRVKHKDQTPFAVPDFTKLTGDELIAKLGGPSLRQSQLACQALSDRKDTRALAHLENVALDEKESPSRRLPALWVLGQHSAVTGTVITAFINSPERNLRREGTTTLGQIAEPDGFTKQFDALANDPDPSVRAELIRALGKRLSPGFKSFLPFLASFGREPLSEPLEPATRNGKLIKIREAYDREFERYLVRLFLERQPELVTAFLDSDAANTLPAENRLLASLALDPKTSASRVAQLLPKLSRPPGQEEVLRLAEFPGEPGVAEALGAVLQNPATRTATLEAMLAVKTRLDAAKLQPILTPAMRPLFASDDATRALAVRVAAGFQLRELEPELVAALNSGAPPDSQVAALRALREMGSGQAELFARLTKSATDPRVRDEALAALSTSKAEPAGKLLLRLWPDLSATERRKALDLSAATKTGAQSIVQAVKAGTIAKTDLDGSILDKLQAVLGKDTDLAALVQETAGLFRPVLALDGSEDALVQTDLTLDGPWTVEAWVRLDPGISNDDGILGAPGQLDINFFDAKLRVWVGGGINDAIIAKRPIVPNLWTHVAVTRDERGFYKVFLDGTLDQDQSKAAPQKFDHLRVAWTAAKGGTGGALSELRIWDRARTGQEIVSTIDRSFAGQPKPPGLTFLASGADPGGKLGTGAKVVKTGDFPPMLTPDEAATLDAKFTTMRARADAPGDAAHGKTVAALCMACHLIQGQGGNLAPNLSSAGAMGTEALLRNILTPNAAMEAGYRIFRVELGSGDIVDSFFVSEDPAAIVVRIPGAEDRRIPRSDIRKTTYLRRSLMPEGLLNAMQPQDVSDLFAYLKTLK